MIDDDGLLSVQEVSKRLGISKYQVYRRITRGDLAALQVRGGSVHYLVPEAALRDYIAAGGANILTPPRRDFQEWVPVSKVAELTGFSRAAIRRMCIKGTLPHTRGKGKRGHLRVERDAVMLLMRQTWD